MTEIQLSDNALHIFNTLYCKANETPLQAMQRVAKEYSTTDEEYEYALDLLVNNVWRPNTPVWFNSNGKEKLFSACWVVPLEDSMEGIYDVANIARKIFGWGSGIGIPIGNLREKDAPIFGAYDKTARCWTDKNWKEHESPHEYDENGNCKYCGKAEFPEGKSSGPIVFMKLYDAVAATTKSGGRARRAAILCAMPIWHPDILDFIHAKEIDGSLSNMNLSVTVTDAFMKNLEDNVPFPLRTPYDGSIIKHEEPSLIWNEIAEQAWKTGDPGIIFIDTVNRFNPIKKEFLIESTNPCLPGYTEVITDKGTMTIEDLLHKDFTSYKIKSYNIDTNEIEWDSILDVKFTKTNAKTIRITIDYISLECTSDHKIYTQNRGYIEAIELTNKDELLLYIEENNTTKTVPVHSIENELFLVNVYDITTVKNHNFFADNILVHNCGETPIPPFMSCNLSMINLAKFVNSDKTFDFEKLFDTAYRITFLMDNLIDVMNFPDPRFKEQTYKFRPLGIGPAGLSDAMFMLDLRYNGKDGKLFAGEVMRTITHGCVRASAMIAKERGTYYNYNKFKEDAEEIVTQLISDVNDTEEVNKTLELVKQYGLRNIYWTTAAPTGTTAISCDTSYGIEPCFGLVWEKKLITGETMKFTNKIFEDRFKSESWFTSDLIDKIYMNSGSLKNLRGIPKEVKDVFIVAHDIKPLDRLELQASLQSHCSQSISSTVNLPSSTTVEEIKELYDNAYKLGLKGVTIYRDGSKKSQPVTFKKEGLEVQSNFVRPDVLTKLSHAIQLTDGKLYIDVGLHEGRVVELWLDYGKSGQDINALLEALGKSLSTGLQHGVPKEAYVRQFKNIKGENPIWHRFLSDDKKPAQIHSIPDAIAKLIEKFYLQDTDKNVIIESSDTICPKCQNNTMKMVEGCATCQACGFSKCS